MGTRKKKKRLKKKKEKGKRGSLREERSLREGTGTKHVRNKLRHANLRHTFFSTEAMQQIVHRKTSEKEINFKTTHNQPDMRQTGV